MGILPPLPESKKPTPAKRKGNQIDFSNLAPLNPAGTKNFSGYREASSFPRAKKGSAYNDREKKIDNDNDDTMDSDADDDDDDDDDDDEKHSRMQAEDGEGDMKDEPKGMLSPEDAARQGELAEGVRKIKVNILVWSVIYSKLNLKINSSNVNTRPNRFPLPHVLPVSRQRQILLLVHAWAAAVLLILTILRVLTFLPPPQIPLLTLQAQ